MALFYPDDYLKSTYHINFEKLRREGYRGIIFDIDNTLVPHGAPADERAIKLFARLKKLGMQSCLLSNNKEPRVASFNEQVQSQYIFKAGKPSKDGYEKAMEMMGTNKKNTIVIGDQIFTDLLGAKRCKLRMVLVRPINPKEEIQIILKRIPEKLILLTYLIYRLAVPAKDEIELAQPR